MADEATAPDDCDLHPLLARIVADQPAYEKAAAFGRELAERSCAEFDRMTADRLATLNAIRDLGGEAPITRKAFQAGIAKAYARSTPSAPDPVSSPEPMSLAEGLNHITRKFRRGARDA